MLESILSVNQNLENSYVADYREHGGRVIGYTCAFTPIEVIEALDLMPFRIKALGYPETDLADARMSRFNCRFCRACLQLGLDQGYDFLDGVLEVNGCDQLRGMFENWQYAKSLPFFHYLKAPHLINQDALDHFVLELQRLIEALCKHFQVVFDVDKLRTAMVNRLRLRHKMKQLYSLREKQTPALSGTQMLEVVLASTSVPIERFEPLLDRVIQECESIQLSSPRARLLMGGAATDEPALLAMVEDLGALVVNDTFCFGSRTFRGMLQIDPEAPDPLRELAHRYLSGCHCPRMVEEFPRRLEFVQHAAKSAGVDGVILVNNKFCDLHGIDNALLSIRLEEQGMPVLSLEKDYGSQADHGRMRTRVQAFLERIGGPR